MDFKNISSRALDVSVSHAVRRRFVGKSIIYSKLLDVNVIYNKYLIKSNYLFIIK
jgi:hypothetical protein